MRMSFLIFIMIIFLYVIYTNWRSLNSVSSKLILIMLGTLNMFGFVWYLLNLKLPFPAEWFYHINIRFQ
jgi:hypothetical protein